MEVIVDTSHQEYVYHHPGWITRNGFCILMDIVIVDLTHTNMVQQKSTTIAYAMTMVA
jgi:hypothetical protein